MAAAPAPWPDADGQRWGGAGSSFGATTFTFAAPLASGTRYDVAVSSQPAGESCSVSSAAGTVSGNVTTVSVTCVNIYTIGGTVSGLKGGAQLTLLDNGADPLTLTANGAFAFSTLLAEGTDYGITVGAQPMGNFVKSPTAAAPFLAMSRARRLRASLCCTVLPT